MITTNTTKQFLPKGMIMLEGASNWDAWDYKLPACASRDKIDYIRTEPDPNLDAVRVTVPLTEPEEPAAKMAQIFEIQTQWGDMHQQNGWGRAPRGPLIHLIRGCRASLVQPEKKTTGNEIPDV